MPRLTPAAVITERLKQAWDPAWYDSIYNQQRYAFGESWDTRRDGPSDRADIPDWPDIMVRFREVGVSRRILNTAFISLSRNMHSPAQPESTQVDKITNEMRKQFWLARYNADDGLGEWGHELENAYMDGDQFGVGFVQIGLKDNPHTGYTRVCLRHSPILHTLWDRHERNPGRAAYMAFLHYVPLSTARKMFGKEAENFVRYLKDGYYTQTLEVVRFLEYYDIGYNGGTPTHCYILDGLTQKPRDIEENQFGVIPAAHIEHFLAPGMRRPIGRVAMQMATQEGINEIERHLRKVLRQSSFTIVDVTSMDRDDLNRVASGETNVPVKWTPGPGTTSAPFVRVPAAEVAQTLLHLKEMLERQFNADSGTNDFEQGNLSDQKRTLGENMLLDQRSEVQSSRMEKNTTEFIKRTVKKVFHVAKLGDRDPILLDVFGRNYLFNDPSTPQASAMMWFDEPSDVVIDSQQMKKQDVAMDQVKELERLKTLEPMVGTMFNPAWYAEQLLDAVGKKEDAKAALIQQTEAAAADGGTMQGLPGPLGMGATPQNAPQEQVNNYQDQAMPAL